MPALQTQCEVLKEKMEIQRQECKELQMNIDSMDIHVKELPAMGNSRTICGNCHHKGHRNQPTNPCHLPKCTDYTYCGNREKHPEYFQKLNKRTTALKEIELSVFCREFLEQERVSVHQKPNTAHITVCYGYFVQTKQS